MISKLLLYAPWKDIIRSTQSNDRVANNVILIVRLLWYILPTKFLKWASLRVHDVNCLHCSLHTFSLRIISTAAIFCRTNGFSLFTMRHSLFAWCAVAREVFAKFNDAGSTGSIINTCHKTTSIIIIYLTAAIDDFIKKNYLRSKFHILRSCSKRRRRARS